MFVDGDTHTVVSVSPTLCRVHWTQLCIMYIFILCNELLDTSAKVFKVNQCSRTKYFSCRYNAMVCAC